MNIKTTPMAGEAGGHARDGVLTQLPFHPLHAAAALATHSRPPVPVHAPARIDHAVLLVGEAEDGQGASSGGEGVKFVDAVTQRGWTLAQQSGSEMLAVHGPHAIKWERHTEFVALTCFLDQGSNIKANSDRLIDFNAVLADLIAPDHRETGVFARMQIDILLEDVPPEQDVIHKSSSGSDSRRGRTDPTPDEPAPIKVLVNGDAVCLATDLHQDAQGVVHYRATLSRRDIDKLPPARIGRLVQRLIEIESYRLLAYLAVPKTQTMGGRVSALEAKVNHIAERTAAQPKPQEEAAILSELTSLSADLQSIGSASEFRFAASLAYSAIVNERLGELQESRIEAYQRLSTAIKRRLDPAMRSCEALLARQQKIAERIGNITELLRTRVDLTLQDQNSAVLRSIDARADAQLRLQQTVEGLSVAAITYYTLGIIGYLVKGAPVEALGLSKTGLQALLVVPVGLIVYFGLKKIRNKAHGPTAEKPHKEGSSGNA